MQHPELQIVGRMSDPGPTVVDYILHKRVRMPGEQFLLAPMDERFGRVGIAGEFAAIDGFTEAAVENGWVILIEERASKRKLPR